MQTHYDYSTGLFFVVNKGHTQTQFFHFKDDGGSPELVTLEKYAGQDNQLHLHFMPKKSVKFMECEVLRAIRITNKHAEFITFKLPRKSGDFQADLYPPCLAGKEALTHDEWAAG